ncbi:MAG: hypothetical protein MJ246_01965 [Clostridia bacterium]|nr:hypothetical protein [Clostridia bacterium]
MTANPETGKIEYNGHEYVKENNSKGYTKYYLVEPLSWQILKVETDDEGQFKVTATTESVIESRIFDDQTTESKQ